MNTIIHTSASRGYADHGWLKSWHTFSFAEYYNPGRMNFGVLRVLNDDIFGKKHGFGMHPHKNMEIVTVVLSGEISHTDSFGHKAVCRKDEVQVMSAGSGIYHSEINESESEDCHLLQLWFLPEKENIKPRYEQMKIDPENRRDSIHTFIAPFGQNTALSLYQDVWISRLDTTYRQKYHYSLHSPNNGLYIFVIEGKIKLNENELNRRDAVGKTDTDNVEFEAFPDAQIIMFEVKMK